MTAIKSVLIALMCLMFCGCVRGGATTSVELDNGLLVVASTDGFGITMAHESKKNRAALLVGDNRVQIDNEKVIVRGATVATLSKWCKRVDLVLSDGQVEVLADGKSVFKGKP